MYHGSTWLFLTLLYHASTTLYLTLCHTLRHSTWIYFFLSLLYFPLLDFTWYYHGSTWLYFPLLYSTMTLLYSLHCAMALQQSTWLYITLFIVEGLYFILLDSTLPCLSFTLLHSTSLYHGSILLNLIALATSLYLNLHYSTMALYTWFYLALC